MEPRRRTLRNRGKCRPKHHSCAHNCKQESCTVILGCYLLSFRCPTHLPAAFRTNSLLSICLKATIQALPLFQQAEYPPILHPRVADTPYHAAKMSRSYLSLIEKSASLLQLNENLEKTIADVKLDERSGEALLKLHVKMRFLSPRLPKFPPSNLSSQESQRTSISQKLQSLL